MTWAALFLSHDNVSFKSSTPGRFLLKLLYWLKDFSSWRHKYLSELKQIHMNKTSKSFNQYGNFNGK